ncbi:MAG: hypothetical protein AAF065_10530 [Verrucomicrobiota bacterium]
MRTYPITFLTLVTALFLSACGGNEQVRITEGSQQIGSSPTGTVYSTSEASIVHVDEITRIATFSNGNQFAESAFLVVNDQNGQQTGLLKAIPQRETGLRTADILEGEPGINDTVSLASEEESAKLSKIYRDPERE